MLIGTVKRDRVKCFGIGGIAAPVDCALLFLPGAANVFNERREAIGAGSGAVKVEQQLRIPFRIEVLVQQNARARRNVESGEKSLIEPFAADEKQRFFADMDRADGKQAEGWAIGQVFTF